MGKIKKTIYSKDLTLLLRAVLMLVILVVVISLTLWFALVRLNNILNPGYVEPEPITLFNFNEFEKLNLMKSGG